MYTAEQYLCSDSAWTSADSVLYPEGYLPQNVPNFYNLGSSDVASYSSGSSPEPNSDGFSTNSATVLGINSPSLFPICDATSPSAFHNSGQILPQLHPSAIVPYGNSSIQNTPTNFDELKPTAMYNLGQNISAVHPIDLSSSSKCGDIGGHFVDDSCQNFCDTYKPYQNFSTQYRESCSWYKDVSYNNPGEWSALCNSPSSRLPNTSFDASKHLSDSKCSFQPSDGDFHETQQHNGYHGMCCSTDHGHGVQRRYARPSRSRTMIPMTVPQQYPESDCPVQKAKKRIASVNEKKRLKSVNEAIQLLKDRIPFEKQRHHKMSKLKVLQFATEYIQELSDLISSVDQRNSQFHNRSSNYSCVYAAENGFRRL